VLFRKRRRRKERMWQSCYSYSLREKEGEECEETGEEKKKRNTSTDSEMIISSESWRMQSRA
jgi:hypothetical protein